MTPTTGSPKINLYNLGSLGVNRVLSPVHKTDGEYLQAQNAQSDKHSQGRDAIKKRWGMALYNALGFGSAVIAIHNLPYGGFADSTGSTGSTGSTASWSGWTEPFATWQRNGPGFWDSTPYTWSYYGTWVEPPGAVANLTNANATTTGLFHATVLGDYLFSQGDILEYDVMTPSYALKSAPPSDPTTTTPPDSGNGWRLMTPLNGDPDYVVQSWLGYSLATGYQQWLYAYRVSTDQWAQVGDMAQWGTGSTYPMMRLPLGSAIAFGDRIYIIREQTLQLSQTGKYRYTVESADATTGGSWTEHLAFDGGTTYESTLALFSDGNYLFVSGRLGGSSGGGAPYTYVNKRSSDGSSWSDVPSLPSSTYIQVLNIDKERTAPAIFAVGDAFSDGATRYPVMVSTDASSSWTTVSMTNVSLSSGGLASGYPRIWRAGDQYFFYRPDDGFSFGTAYVWKTAANSFGSLSWSTVSDLGDAMYYGGVGVNPSVMSLTPRTKF